MHYTRGGNTNGTTAGKVFNVRDDRAFDLDKNLQKIAPVRIADETDAVRVVFDSAIARIFKMFDNCFIVFGHSIP